MRVSHKEDLFELPIAGSFEAKSIVNFLGLDMTDVDNEAAYISPLDDEIIRKDYAEMTLQSKKYNRLIFRSPVNDLITVRITGSIEFPGSYTLNANTSLDELYKLIGKFKEEAFTEGIVFKEIPLRNNNWMQSKFRKKN